MLDWKGCALFGEDLSCRTRRAISLELTKDVVCPLCVVCVVNVGPEFGSIKAYLPKSSAVRGGRELDLARNSGKEKKNLHVSEQEVILDVNTTPGSAREQPRVRDQSPSGARARVVAVIRPGSFFLSIR